MQHLCGGDGAVSNAVMVKTALEGLSQGWIWLPLDSLLCPELPGTSRGGGVSRAASPAPSAHRARPPFSHPPPGQPGFAEPATFPGPSTHLAPLFITSSLLVIRPSFPNRCFPTLRELPDAHRSSSISVPTAGDQRRQ